MTTPSLTPGGDAASRGAPLSKMAASSAALLVSKAGQVIVLIGALAVLLPKMRADET